MTAVDRVVGPHDTDRSDLMMALAPVPELSVLDLDAPDWRSVLDELGHRAERTGHARPGFAAALVDRESHSPTGLPTPVPVAIPHGDPHLINRPGIALARLARPVAWGEMGAAGQASIEVHAVLVLMVAQAHSQVEVLSRLMQVLQGEQWYAELRDAAEVTDACTRLRDRLQAP